MSSLLNNKGMLLSKPIEYTQFELLVFVITVTVADLTLDNS